MGKRLSKARRSKALNRKLVIARAHANDDSHLLQRGAIQSPLTRSAANIKGLALPRGISLDTSGRKPRASPQRFTINGFTPEKVDALLAPHVKD